MKKMAGVENVEAKLNEGKAVITLKPGNTVRFDDLIKVVRDKAFTPKEARVSVRGELVPGKPQLRVSGTNDVYDLSGPAAAEFRKSTAKVVLVEGIIPAPKDKAYLKAIEVKSFKPAT
jgi:hypothetical protein